MLNSIKQFFLIIITACFLLLFVSNESFCKQQDIRQNDKADNNAKGMLVEGIFDIPELSILPSPDKAQSITFSASEKIIDYDVSPAGMVIAALTKTSDDNSHIKFWEIGKKEISESFNLPDGLKSKAITWHPNASAIFVMGEKDSNYQIFRVEKIKNKWSAKGIFTSKNPLRRLVVCPRPFITRYDFKNNKEYYAYRLFFGMDNGDKSYRIVSITEKGERFYQVIGPAKTITKLDDAEEQPLKMTADWALPLAFHPAGHQMIWEDKNKNFLVARYNLKNWGDVRPIKLSIKTNGSITPTPNGLGFIHWQKDKPGIGVYMLSTKNEEIQLADYNFISTPSSLPDGRGIVGLTASKNGEHTLNYIPVNVPLPDVVNAWMFAKSMEETGLFQKNFGLFRAFEEDDQLYKLYEKENYYCSGYDRNAPTRPYLVTTDIFWELFAAAYQGLFIIKERDEAMPNFWKFIDDADKYLRKTNNNSAWAPVFTALNDLQSGNLNNPEVARILKEQDAKSEITKEDYTYSDLKPRGHYTSSPEMEKYFRAFRYFTTIYKEKNHLLKELNSLPKEIISHAEEWINSYAGFIAPSRSPLVWDNLKTNVPDYCKYPCKDLTIFPLSWGFDNEIFYSTVYHQNLPPELQITGPNGPRMHPSGLDLAAVLGSGIADKVLQIDYEKYPPLRKVIGNLKENFKTNKNNPQQKDNLYSQWINAASIQWADSIESTNGAKDKAIWQTKRLQTGLATWATLRHATILVNERTAAECGEGGFEEILMRAPRGYVEPDPATFSKIAELFDTAIKYVAKSTSKKSDIQGTDFDNPDYNNQGKRSLYEGITARLKEAAKDARAFQTMAEKERKGAALSNEEYEKILYVARTAEHLFLIFNSLSNKDYALSNPDPVAKIADVAGGGMTPYLMAAVGYPLEWDYIVPYYGRRQIVKGSVYSYYEFVSDKILNDEEWRENAKSQEILPWLKPFHTSKECSGMPETSY